MELNENQFLFLEFLLNKKGITEKEIQEELLDHLAAGVESKMDNNILFHDAVDETLSEFGEDNFKLIYNNRLTLFNQKNKKKMKRIILFIFIFLGTIILLMARGNYWNNEKMYADSDNSTDINFAIQVNQEPPEAYPVKGDFPITSSFGKRLHPIHKVMRFHKGIDIKAPIGTDVVATSDGEIIKAEIKKSGYGIHVVIKHDETYKSLYAHLSTMNVKKGDFVKKGDKIGEVGATGSTVLPHLHYEIQKEGESVDPKNYIRM